MASRDVMSSRAVGRRPRGRGVHVATPTRSARRCRCVRVASHIWTTSRCCWSRRSLRGTAFWATRGSRGRGHIRTSGRFAWAPSARRYWRSRCCRRCCSRWDCSSCFRGWSPPDRWRVRGRAGSRGTGSCGWASLWPSGCLESGRPCCSRSIVKGTTIGRFGTPSCIAIHSLNRGRCGSSRSC